MRGLRPRNSLTLITMSKIGRQPIIILDGVTVKTEGNSIIVSGPKGIAQRVFSPLVHIEIGEKQVTVTSENPAFWGTWRAHVANMVKGVREGFSKQLGIQGIGYKVQLQSNTLVFSLGFSHPVTVTIPEGIEVAVKENTITVSGIDKEKIGQFASYLRSLRPPDAYKGKGIRYVGEVIKLKPGKKAGVGAA